MSKMNKKNGIELSFTDFTSAIITKMMSEYSCVRQLDKINVDYLINEYDSFKSLDKTIVCKTELGIYKDFKDILNDITELLVVYSRIAAFKYLICKRYVDSELIKEYEQVHKQEANNTIIFMLISKEFSCIEEILEYTFVNVNNFAMTHVLLQLIMNVFKAYNVSIVLDNKNDIVRIVTNKNRFVIKKFYIV